MSLLDFPPLDRSGCPYCIQELNGRLVYGSEEDVDLCAKAELVIAYFLIIFVLWLLLCEVEQALNKTSCFWSQGVVWEWALTFPNFEVNYEFRI